MNIMMKIKTQVDELLDFIRTHRKIRSEDIPKHLKGSNYEAHLRILEARGFIEIKYSLFGKPTILYTGD
jgi:hypothetical protein